MTTANKETASITFSSVHDMTAREWQEDMETQGLSEIYDSIDFTVTTTSTLVTLTVSTLGFEMLDLVKFIGDICVNIVSCYDATIEEISLSEDTTASTEMALSNIVIASGMQANNDLALVSLSESMLAMSETIKKLEARIVALEESNDSEIDYVEE